MYLPAGFYEWNQQPIVVYVTHLGKFEKTESSAAITIGINLPYDGEIDLPGQFDEAARMTSWPTENSTITNWYSYFSTGTTSLDVRKIWVHAPHDVTDFEDVVRVAALSSVDVLSPIDNTVPEYYFWNVDFGEEYFKPVTTNANLKMQFLEFGELITDNIEDDPPSLGCRESCWDFGGIEMHPVAWGDDFLQLRFGYLVHSDSHYDNNDPTALITATVDFIRIDEPTEFEVVCSDDAGCQFKTDPSP